MFEWENGALGSFHASTAEAGQDMGFENIGKRDHLQVPQDVFKFNGFGTDILEYIKVHEISFQNAELVEESVELDPVFKGSHRDVHRKFYRAVVDGTPVNPDGATGIRRLEIANAMTYSSHTGQAVEFPLDRQAYGDLLATLQAKELSRN